MSIRVTCTNCHTRFNVSDKFAGKEGPCPKCKKTIRVPDVTEDVVIHAPADGPKDSQGRSIVKPIRRTETTLSNVQIAILAASIIGFLIGALTLRLMLGSTNPGETSQVPTWLLAVAAIGIAPPIVYVAYLMLRDQELGTFVNRELWNRVLLCSGIYALLWAGFWLGSYAFPGNNLGAWVVSLVPMLGIGAACGMLAFDFDYLFGLVHYGMYVAVCLIGRLLAGVGVLPSSPAGPRTRTTTTTTAMEMFQGVWNTLADLLANIAG